MECIFCGYQSNVRKQHIIFEDDEFAVFLSKRSLSPGHTILIPKQHAEKVWDVDNIRGMFMTAEKVALGITKVMQTDNINIQLNYGSIRIRIPHLHLHLIPVYSRNLTPLRRMFRMTVVQMDEIAKRIRAEL